MTDRYDRETEAIRMDYEEEWSDTIGEEHAGHMDGLDARDEFEEQSAR